MDLKQILGDGEVVRRLGDNLDGLALAPISATRTAGDIAVTNTAGAWVDLDPTGTAAARNLDLVIPGVRAGDWITGQINGLLNNGAGLLKMDFYTVVASAAVNAISGNTTGGIAGCDGVLSTHTRMAGRQSYQLVSGDIENGSVRLRVRYRTDGNRTIFAQAAFPFHVEASGPFA